MVEVGNSQYHLNHLASLFIPEVGMIPLTAELATVMRPLQDGGSYMLPVGGIAFLILWLNRHGYSKVNITSFPSLRCSL